MEQDKVSIIIPVYNGEKYLLETINSCINQEYQNTEIIVMDDSSTDSSREIAHSFGNKIVYKFNEINLGISKTFNKGAEISTGKYLIFLGQDDLLPVNHISELIKEFNDSVSFVYCNSIIIDSNGNEKYKTYEDKKQLQVNKRVKFHLCMRNVISSTGLIMRRGDYLKVKGYDLQFKHYGEWLLWIKLLTKGQCKYSVSSTVFYRRHDSNITNSFTNKQVKIKLRKYYDFCRSVAYKEFYRDLKISEKFIVRLYYILNPLKYKLVDFKSHNSNKL